MAVVARGAALACPAEPPGLVASVSPPDWWTSLTASLVTPIQFIRALPLCAPGVLIFWKEDYLRSCLTNLWVKSSSPSNCMSSCGPQSAKGQLSCEAQCLLELGGPGREPGALLLTHICRALWAPAEAASGGSLCGAATSLPPEPGRGDGCWLGAGSAVLCSGLAPAVLFHPDDNEVQSTGWLCLEGKKVTPTGVPKSAQGHRASEYGPRILVCGFPRTWWHVCPGVGPGGQCCVHLSVQSPLGKVLCPRLLVERQMGGSPTLSRQVPL